MALHVATPVPYQGSKRKLASQILSYIPTVSGTLYEPFAGSAAISLAALATGRARRVFLSDILGPLMGVWDIIVKEPARLASEYEVLWFEQFAEPRLAYSRIRAEFNASQDPSKLLYLIARCVKNSIRFNPRGEFNQSPDNRRRGMHPSKMRKEIFEAHGLLSGRSTTRCADYRETLEVVTSQDVVYMDPPYQGVSGSKDRRYVQALDFGAFVSVLDGLNKRGISYLISLDGKCGDKSYGRQLPAFLGLDQKMLLAGRSSQATLLGRNQQTVESLYISPALAERVQMEEPGSILTGW